MTIYPSAKIRQDYNLVSQEAKKTNEPIFLTKNGEGDLVVMSLEAFNKREKMLKLREELIQVEEDRIRGAKSYTLEEAKDELNRLIDEL